MGTDYILEEVGLVFQRDRFKRLIDIAQHPTLSKRPKCLWFQGGRLDDNTGRANWEKRRRDLSTLDRRRINMPNIEPIRTDRWRRAWRRASKKWYDARQGVFSEQELEAAYRAYLRHVEDQKTIVEEGFDVSCSTSLFKGCPNLHCVTVTCAGAARRGLATCSRAFHDGMITPNGDVHWQSEGVHQTVAVVQALCCSGRGLHSMTLGDVSHRLFKECDGTLQQL